LLSLPVNLPVKKLLIDKGQGEGVWLIVFCSDYRCSHSAGTELANGETRIQR
jgi:hypothetical protein